MVTPATTTPGTSATTSGIEPRTAVSVAWPRPRTTVFARLTSMLRAMSYTPGVSSRFLPRASCWLMTCAESDGLATKKSPIGSVRPGVMPPAHVTPRVPFRAAGTRTWYLPRASAYR